MTFDWNEPLRLPKRKALPRPLPEASPSEKKNYAERLSRGLAEMLADALRTKPSFRSISPKPDGSGHEAPTRVDGGKKKLDVRLINEELGLVFSASIKTYSFRDYSPQSRSFGRYQKNVVRNDMELRAEADVVHRRQPYAVMVALFFMHEGATTDGTNKHSSFAHAAFTLRKRAGRRDAFDQRFDRFEKVYIGLFDPDRVDDGRVVFFDVENSPPRNGMPRHTKSLRGVVEEIDHLVKIRNEVVYDYDDGAEAEDLDLGDLSVGDVMDVDTTGESDGEG